MAVCVAGVAFGDIHFHFTWQASSLVTSTCTLAWQAWAGSGGALGFRCGAGTPRLLAWQVWHLETSIFVSRGRRGTWWHRLLLWRGRHGTYGTGLALVARLVLGVVPGRRGCWRGRRGTWRHPSSFHVAGVRLPLLRGSCGAYGSWRGDIHLRFTWQAWCSRATCRHTTYSHTTCGAGMPRLLAWQAWHLETSIFVSRGRRGTWWHRLLLWRGRHGTYGTGLALVARLVLGVAPGRRGCWRGRRGTWRHPSSFHVAGVRLPLLRGSCGTYGSWRGRRGIWRYLLSFHLAGVVLGDIDLHFCVAGVARMAVGWLRWRLGWRGAPGRRGCWRGRRGTWRHPPSFHVAGVALGEINTSAASLALLRTLWHVCVGWDCRTCVICSHLTPCSQTHCDMFLFGCYFRACVICSHFSQTATTHFENMQSHCNDTTTRSQRWLHRTQTRDDHLAS